MGKVTLVPNLSCLFSAGNIREVKAYKRYF